jgi:hypothetical protein
MGPIEILKLEIEREVRGEIMREFQRMAESSGRIPERIFLLDRIRRHLEFAGSFLLGMVSGVLALFVLYSIVKIMA